MSTRQPLPSASTSTAPWLREIRRPPHNFFDIPMASTRWSRPSRRWTPTAAATPWCWRRKAARLCAGAPTWPTATPRRSRPARARWNPLYGEAIRPFSLQPAGGGGGARPAIGGLGLALVADSAVTCPEARFGQLTRRLGFHPGFGMSVTLPRRRACRRRQLSLFFTRPAPVGGHEGARDRPGRRAGAVTCARGAARTGARDRGFRRRWPCSPRARHVRRKGLRKQIRLAVAHESTGAERAAFKTADFREGAGRMLRAARRASPVAERRRPSRRHGAAPGQGLLHASSIDEAGRAVAAGAAVLGLVTGHAQRPGA